jgi:polyisoprenoid-binding protein YceI
VKSTNMTGSDLSRLAGTWRLDPDTTSVTFRTKAMWILPIKGTAKALSGDAQVKPDGAAVKGTLVIDAASFDTKNEKRDDHLRSEDNANRAGDGRFNSPGRPKGAAWRTGRRAQSAP